MALRLAFSPTFTVISAAPVIAALFLSHGFAGSVSVGSHPALGLFTGILILSGFPSRASKPLFQKMKRSNTSLPSGPGLAASS